MSDRDPRRRRRNILKASGSALLGVAGIGFVNARQGTPEAVIKGFDPSDERESKRAVIQFMDYLGEDQAAAMNLFRELSAEQQDTITELGLTSSSVETVSYSPETASRFDTQETDDLSPDGNRRNAWQWQRTAGKNAVGHKVWEFRYRVDYQYDDGEAVVSHSGTPTKTSTGWLPGWSFEGTTENVSPDRDTYVRYVVGAQFKYCPNFGIGCPVQDDNPKLELAFNHTGWRHSEVLQDS